MVVIRLSRSGAKKHPFYHISITDKRNRRDGRYIARAGYFNPCARGKEVDLYLDLEKINFWVAKGAQLSDTVKQLIKKYQRSLAAKAAQAA